jgi:hypothetical protein
MEAAMSELMRERGDGAELPINLVSQEGSQIELDGQRLLAALEAIAASKLPMAAESEKYVARLNFALDRVAETRRDAERDGGAFAPARAEVALSILEGHVAFAAGFINRTMQTVRRTAGRRERRVSVDEAVNLVEEQKAEDETRAA